MKNNLIGLTIGAAVAIIVLASVLVPVLDDETDHSVTFHNEPFGASHAYSDETPVTLDFVDGVYSVNGVPTVPLGTAYSAVSSDGLILRPYNDTMSGCYKDPDGVWHLLPSGNFHITANNGQGVITTNGTELEFTYTKINYQDEQDYSMTIGRDSDPFYLASNTEVFCCGYNGDLGASGLPRFFIMSGSIADGFTLNSLTGYTAPLKEIVYEKVDGYEDLYKVTKFIFEGPQYDVTVSRLIVPETIIATENHNPAVDSIMSVIPMLIIVAIIVGVVSVALRARD